MEQHNQVLTEEEKEVKKLLVLFLNLLGKETEEKPEIFKLSGDKSSTSYNTQFLRILQGLYTAYMGVTGDTNNDLVGFTHLLNRLVISDLLENENTKIVDDTV